MVVPDDEVVGVSVPVLVEVVVGLVLSVAVVVLQEGLGAAASEVAP